MKDNEARPTTTGPANDDAPQPENAISFTDLCAAMGEDEDVVLERLAGILDRRAQAEESNDGHAAKNASAPL